MWHRTRDGLSRNEFPVSMEGVRALRWMLLGCFVSILM